MDKLKDLMEKRPYFFSTTTKTHIRKNGRDNGITGFYTKEELKKWENCDAEIREYEKDYGDGAIAIRKFLAIDVYDNQG